MKMSTGCDIANFHATLHSTLCIAEKGTIQLQKGVIPYQAEPQAVSGMPDPRIPDAYTCMRETMGNLGQKKVDWTSTGLLIFRRDFWRKA